MALWAECSASMSGLRAPTLASYFLDACDDPLDAASYEKRLSNGLLPAELRTGSLVDRLPELERRLVERVAFLDTAINSAEHRPTPAALVASLLADSVVAPAPPQTGQAATADHGGLSDTATSVLRDNDLSDALLAANFRQCALTISTIDTSTQDGRRDAFAAAFGSGSALIVRLLLHGGTRLAKSHELLAFLHSLRPYLHDYFSYCQTLQADGSRGPRAAKWSWTGEANESDTQLKLFMRQDFVGMNWVDAPYGAHGLKEILSGSRIAAIDSADHYVVIAALEEVSSFGTNTFAAIGYSADVPADAGYSWRSFHDLYISHLKKATALASLDEIHKWLHKSDTHYRSALREIGRTVRRTLESPKPRDEAFGALLPRDAFPVVSLLEMQSDMEELTTHREKWDWLKGTKPVAIRVDQLPLLSAYLVPRKGKRERSPTPERGTKRSGKRVSFAADGDSDDGDRGGDRGDGGSLARGTAPLSFWLAPLSLLYVSGKVWNVSRIARDLKVNVKAKCWPTVLSLKEDKNRLSVCPTPKKAGHTSLADAAHKLSKPAHDLIADYTRAPTPSEAARLQKQGVISTLRSRGQGSGRGQGKGRPSPQ